MAARPCFEFELNLDTNTIRNLKQIPFAIGDQYIWEFGKPNLHQGIVALRCGMIAAANPRFEFELNLETNTIGNLGQIHFAI